MIVRRAAVVLVAAGLGGCGASLPGTSTGSLFGGGDSKPAAAPVVQNDPAARALQVGTTSARAIKCGFNFDPVKLRTQFLATEAAASPADSGKLGQMYDTSASAVAKVVAGQGQEYCSPTKTAQIKQALNRHLAGDYTPTPPEPVEAEGGIFSDLGGSSSSAHSAPTAHPGIDE